MNPLISFTIPVKGLKMGEHEYVFNIDSTFFKAVNEESNVQANLQVNVIFDKRPNMYILDFHIVGDAKDTCDRCLEHILIPIDSTYQLIIKRGMGEDEADLVYLEHFDDEINIAEYIYDYALISFPMIKVIDCDEMDDPPCNFELLEKWESESDAAQDEDKGGIWDALNNLNLDK